MRKIFKINFKIYTIFKSKRPLESSLERKLYASKNEGYPL